MKNQRQISKTIFLFILSILTSISISYSQDVSFYWKTPVSIVDQCGGSAVNIIDRDKATTWFHWVEEAHWVILDMGETSTISKICTWHERQWDTERGLTEIYVSTDTSDWGESLGSMKNTQNQNPGWIEVDITDKVGRYIKLVFETSNSPYWREMSVYFLGEPDAIPPSAINDLSITSTSATTIDLNWTASGDDSTSGTAYNYDIRYFENEISENNWDSAYQASGEPAPSDSGTAESFKITDLNPSTTYYVAIKVMDEQENLSAISNLVVAKTSTDSLPKEPFGR